MTTKTGAILTVVMMFVISCGKGADSSGDSGGSGGDAVVTTSVQSGQSLSGHPHLSDYYIPSNATSAVVFLHGGGGKKEGMAYNMGIKTTDDISSYTLSTTGAEWLKTNKVLAVFPQGRNRAVLAWTWNNYVMDSGEDDVGFLQDLVTHIRSTYPAITKVYLVGHSNGGMMANRMWCESPTTFDAYGSMAGPAALALGAGQTHPCNSSSPKPYFGIVGDHDTVLQTGGNMTASPWIVSLYNGSSSAWVSDSVINEKNFHTVRVTQRCSGTPAAPTTSGQFTTYSDCSSSIKLMIVAQTGSGGSANAGDHCLLSLSASCITTLAGSTGLDYKTTLFNFLKSY